jgi:hypothetical protein
MRNRTSPVLISLLALFAATGLAQEDRAVVTGSVTDPSKASIGGAIVSIDNKATGFHQEVKTNDSGAYVIPGLLVGIYDLQISMNGFTTQNYNAIELVVGQIRTINAQMQIAASSQEVQVHAETQALDQSTAKVAGVVDSTQVSELPINGRAWTALMALVPGAMDSAGGTQKSIRFAGRGGDDNNFRFDGMDATGISNQAPNTSTRLQISTEAIAEFKVDTMLYGADTGGTNGGQVEVISKSGTNDFHGSVFEFLRNNVLKYPRAVRWLDPASVAVESVRRQSWRTHRQEPNVFLYRLRGAEAASGNDADRQRSERFIPRHSPGGIARCCADYQLLSPWKPRSLVDNLTVCFGGKSECQ